MSILEKIQKGRLVPVIALDDAADAAPLCQALSDGGLEVAEITFRTAAAPEAIKIVAEQFPDFALGAGTVTTPEELQRAIEAGAKFAVAPGCNPKILKLAEEARLPFYPGVATPSDIEAALECGCQTLKFFPAGPMGGPSMIKALYAPYGHRGIKFIPTGGISSSNIKEYLATPGVIACGGSWIVAKPLLKEKNWAKVTELTKEALASFE